MNPLAFLFKSGASSSEASSGKGEEKGGLGDMKRDRGRRKVLEKSKSMMDRYVRKRRDFIIEK